VGNFDSVFDITSSSARVSLSGLTITGGGAVQFGGGIDNLGTLMVSQCTISGNEAQVGGGIYNAGILTLSLCSVSNNEAASGGGIYNDAAGMATVSQTNVSDNSFIVRGGGIDNEGTMTISQSAVSGNFAVNDRIELGGGIFNNGTLTISQSTVSGNSARSGGGGIYNLGTLFVLHHSTITGNSPDDLTNTGTFTYTLDATSTIGVID
jgi:hypothetical protein